MAKARLTEREQVDELIAKLDPVELDFVEYMRSMVLTINPLISEQVKWNSLSFYFTGEMQPFDPKEYKRDILVCNIHRGKFLLVFPTGAKLTDELKGKNYPDGRKIITLENLEDARQKTAGVEKLIVNWLEAVE